MAKSFSKMQIVGDCFFKRHTCYRIVIFHHIFFSDAKAHMTELERVRLQCMVQSLRTTDCKRTRSNSVMCAFAPPEKILRHGLERACPCMLINTNTTRHAS